jgi:hypothetical protein
MFTGMTYDLVNFGAASVSQKKLGSSPMLDSGSPCSAA